MVNTYQSERFCSSATFEEDKEMLIKLATSGVSISFYEEFLQGMKQVQFLIKNMLDHPRRYNCELYPKEGILLAQYLDLIESRVKNISRMFYTKRFDFESLREDYKREMEIINIFLKRVAKEEIKPKNNLGAIMNKYGIDTLFIENPTFNNIYHFNNDYILLSILSRLRIQG